MSTPFQNRLVGTIIISAAAIIFLPDILDGKKNQQLTEFSPIPKAKPFQGEQKQKPFPQAQLSQLPQQPISDEQAVDENTMALTEQDANNNAESQPAINKDEQQHTDKKVVAAKANKPPEFNDKPSSTTNSKPLAIDVNAGAKTDNAWVIQLGVFKHQKNVEQLVQNLKQQGYTVFTKPIKTRSGFLTKVFVGPELSRQMLEQQLLALNKLTKMKGKIAKFNAAQP